MALPLSTEAVQPVIKLTWAGLPWPLACQLSRISDAPRVCVSVWETCAHITWVGEIQQTAPLSHEASARWREGTLAR